MCHDCYLDRCEECLGFYILDDFLPWNARPGVDIMKQILKQLKHLYDERLLMSPNARTMTISAP